jgi:hypothetical protein
MISKDARALGREDSGNLSDDDYDDMQERKYDDEVYHEIMEDFSDVESQTIEETEGEIDSLSRDISVKSFESSEVESVRFHNIVDPNEAFEDGGGREVDEREEKNQVVLDINRAKPGDAAQEKKPTGIRNAIWSSSVLSSSARSASITPWRPVPHIIKVTRTFHFPMT